MSEIQRVETIVFNKIISPLGKGNIEKTIDNDATVEEVIMTFPQGQKGDLKIRAVVVNSDRTTSDIISFAGDSDPYMTGDNATRRFRCTMPISAKNKIQIIYESVDAVNNMQLMVDVVVDYYGGKERFL